MSKELDKETYTKAEAAELIREATEEVTEKAEVTAIIAEMSDVEKSYYNGLSDEAKGEFLYASAEDRGVAITKATEDDAVVYIAKNGDEYRKSDDPRLIKMAKERDADRAEMLKRDIEIDNARLTKLAETEYQNLAGDVETRVAIIKSVESIKDEEKRTAALTALKAQNAKLAKSFETVGHGGAPNLESENATKELDTLTKQYQKDHRVENYFDAYDVVAKANPELYNKAVNS